MRNTRAYMVVGITISTIERSDIDRVCELWDEHYPPRDPVVEAVENAVAPSDDDWKGLVVRHGGEVVGFSLLYFTETPTEALAVPDDMLEDHAGADGVLTLAVVHPDFRGHGFGTRLTTRRVRLAQHRTGVSRVSAVAWGEGQRLIEPLGFEKVGEVEDYFPDHPGDVTVHRRWL